MKLEPSKVVPLEGEFHECNNGNIYPLVEYEGKVYYQLSNGTLKSTENGQIVASDPDMSPLRTDNKSVQRARRRKAAEAVAEGMKDGVMNYALSKGLTKISEIDAVKLIAEKVAFDAINTHSVQSRINAADWLMINSGLKQVNDSGDNGTPALRLELNEEGMSMLQNILGKIRSHKS